MPSRVPVHSYPYIQACLGPCLIVLCDGCCLGNFGSTQVWVSALLRCCLTYRTTLCLLTARALAGWRRGLLVRLPT